MDELQTKLVVLDNATDDAKTELQSLFDIIKNEDLPLDKIFKKPENINEVTKKIADLRKRLQDYRIELNGINDQKDKNGIAGFQASRINELNTSIANTIKEIKALQALDDVNEKKGKKPVDALQTRVEALKELIAAGIDAEANTIELRNLKVKILFRDAKINGLSDAEAQELADLIQNPNLKPVTVKLPAKVDVTVADSIEAFDKAGDNLSQAQARMYARIAESGVKAGTQARKRLGEPLRELNSEIKNIGAQALSGFGEAIGDALAGGDLVAGFINVIADAVSALGKALIAYAAARIAADNAIKSLNPYVALAAGIAAVAAGAYLKKKLNDKPRAMAEGGLVLGPTRALIGERGPELVLPLNQINSLLGSKSGDSGGTVHFEIEGNRLVGVLARANTKNGRTY